MSVKGYFDDNFTLMQLGFGIRFDDLYEREGLMRLDEAFLRFLGEADTALHDRLLAARQNPAIKDESDLLVALASCYAAALAWAARKRGIELPDLTVTATGSYDGPRFRQLVLTVTTSFPRDQLDRLLRPALAVCYVSNAIDAATPIDVAVA